MKMGNFYLDIETTGLNPQVDKIITIQFQELDRHTGKPVGDLIVLKEWESSERQILQEFIFKSKVHDKYPFSFVPIGYNLTFEHNFLKERTTAYGLRPIDILSLPFIDLRSLGVLINKGEFSGSGLDKITGKKQNGSKVPMWYANKQYDLILDYVKNESEEFLKFLQKMYVELPKLKEKF